MSLLDRIEDTFPANDDVGVPLLSTITITFDRLMDESDLNDNFFVEGPDTDQFVGPGLALLEFPNNTSQGEVDDFLRSPGYRGIVQGATTFTTISGSPDKTLLTFTPTQPLYPLTEYTIMISDSLDASGITHSGMVTLDFQTGSGSIEEIPTETSSSILKTTAQPGILSTSGALQVVSTTPADHSVEQDPKELTDIIIEFNKELDPATVTGNVSVLAEVATDHPNANAVANGALAKVVTVSGRKITVSI